MEKFSVRLKSEMEKKGIQQKELEEKLVKAGITNISHKRISEYVREISTPGYDKAKEIFDILDVSVTDKELKEMLRVNREDIRKSHEEYDFELSTYSKKITLQIMLRDILPATSPEYIESILNARVEELFSGSEMTEKTKYVEKLIRDDLAAYMGSSRHIDGIPARQKRKPGRASLAAGSVFNIVNEGGNKKK